MYIVLFRALRVKLQVLIRPKKINSIFPVTDFLEIG